MLRKIGVFLLLMVSLNQVGLSQNNKPVVIDLSFENLKSIDTSLVKSQNVTALILDGNPIDLMECKAFLSSLTNLEFLSLRNCNLDILPVEIESLKSLKVLDVSGNRLRFLPYSLKELDQLEELDLSDNRLDSLGFKIGRLSGLKELNISGNRNVDLSAQNFQDVQLDVFSAMGVEQLPQTLKESSSITKLVIGENSKSDLGELIEDSSSIEEVFVYSKERSGFTSLVNDLKKTQVTKLSIGSSKLKNLPSGLSRLDSLNDLVILESPIKQLPVSFNQLKQITRLTINASELKELSKSINRLQNLRYLNIENTAIDEEELKKLIAALPNCEIIFNSKLMGDPAVVEREEKPRDININDIEFTKVSKRIDPQRKSVIELSKGAQLSIPANAFVDSKGNLIEDSVLVDVKELNDPLSLFMEQVPLDVDSEEGNKRLAPSKTYLITGETNGKDSVFINPKNKPKLSVPKSNDGDVYVFKVKKNKWNNQDSLQKRLDYLDSLLTRRNDSNLIYNPFTDHVSYDKVYLQIKDKKKYGGTCIRLLGSGGSSFKKKFGSDEGGKVSFYQVNAISNIEWLIVSENSEVEKQALASILNLKVKTTTQSKKGYLIKDLENFIIEHDSIKDVLVFRFITKEKEVSIDVIPTSDVYDQINGAQREIARVFKKYIRNKGQIDDRNGKVHDLFKKKYDKYLLSYRRIVDSVSRGEDNFDQYATNSYLYKNITSNFMGSSEIGVGSFGLLAIGNMESEIDQATFQSAKISPVDTSGQKLAVINLIVLAKWGNTYRYGTPNRFDYPILKKVALLGLLANGDYALLSSSAFWKLRIGNKDNDFGNVEFEIVQGESFNIEDYRKKLKI